MKVKRSTKDQATLGVSDVASMTYNGRAGATKQLPVGPQLKTPAASATIVAIDASAGIQMPPGTSLALYNNGALAWVTMSQATIGTAPSGLSSGIPLVANGWTYLNMGDNTYIRTSASTVGVYIIQDDTSLQTVPDDQAF